MVCGSCFVAKSLLRRVAQDVATAIETESILVDQPKDAELEYRVIAINLVPENLLSWFCNRGKSGEGQPSNMVMVVL